MWGIYSEINFTFILFQKFLVLLTGGDTPGYTEARNVEVIVTIFCTSYLATGHLHTLNISVCSLVSILVTTVYLQLLQRSTIILHVPRNLFCTNLFEKPKEDYGTYSQFKAYQ